VQIATSDNPPMLDAPPDPASDIARETARAASAPGAAQVGRREAWRAALILAGALVVCIVAYLALATPGAWFPRASERVWHASELGLVRGSGRLVGDALVVTAPDGAGVTLVNVVTDFRSADYPAIAWRVDGLAPDAEVQLLWRTDVQPNKLQSTPVRVEEHRAVVTTVAGEAGWMGRVTGLALAIHGPLAQPVVIAGVVAKPMGVAGLVRDRLHDWFVFEPWNGASINTIAGGEDYQAFPLPVLLALAVGLAGLAVVGASRVRPALFGARAPLFIAVFFLCAWVVLDTRWTWNLVRQERATATRYAGKDVRDKHLANEDADLYAFVERALAVLPKTPVRIFIASDADYFRGRAAYHLYPHRVFFDPRSNRLPEARELHRGDWLLVYRQRGIQFDRGQGKVRWDGGQIVDADLKLVEPGAALFEIR
jgi:hypothetical protein